MVTDYCGPIPFKQKLLVMRTNHNIFWLLNCNQHNDISQNCVRLSIFVALVFLARYWLCNSSGQSIHHVFWFTSARSVYCSIFIWLLLLLFQSTEFVHNHILSPFFSFIWYILNWNDMLYTKAIDRYTVWLNAHLTEWVMYIKRMNDAHKIVLSDFSYTNPDNFDNWIVIAALMPPSLDSIHRDNIHIFLSFKISLFFVIESIFDEESRVMRYLELIWRKNDNQMSFDSLALITKKSLL